ncbi:MAG: PepSY domain-containing protein [Bifidobacteriaceae bacterium]|jgi:uncharacterized membrane protein YkoI|nr:PepSY domain-containing protein [Bifidobacteriaceae bacterium]
MTPDQLPAAAPTSTRAPRRRLGATARNILVALSGVALVVVVTALTTAALMPGGASAGPVVGGPVHLSAPAAASAAADAASAATDQSNDLVGGGALPTPSTPAPSAASAPPSAPAPTPALTAAPTPAPTAAALISEEQAKQIALAQVPGANSIRLHLSRDDGRDEYEGEIIHGWTEYEFEIDAVTGEILEWEADHVLD